MKPWAKAETYTGLRKPHRPGSPFNRQLCVGSHKDFNGPDFGAPWAESNLLEGKAASLHESS